MFRSPRLEALFGKRLDQVDYADIDALCGRDEAAEAADLDYKEFVHARKEERKVEFCKDVIAMANYRGGILLVGVKEDGQRAVPENVTKVDVREGERLRFKSILLNTAPHPLPADVVALEDPGDRGRGVLLVVVEQSPLAPHAILDTRDRTHHKDGWLRFPIRDGAATRWMLEPELATRYRRRFAEARALADRLDEIEEEAFAAYIARYPTRESQVPAYEEREALPVLTVVLAPEIPGTLRLNREVFTTFQHAALSERLIGESDCPIFTQVAISSGRLLGIAGGRRQTTRYAELHADGSGVLMFNLDPFHEDGAVVKVRPPQCLQWLLSGLLALGRHGRDRAGASGAVSVRLRLLSDAGLRHYEPVEARPDDRSLQLVEVNGWEVGPRVEEALGAADAFVDDVADPGTNLISVASLLADQGFHAFGQPEVDLITADGRIVPERWGPWSDAITSWAQLVGLA